MNGHEILSETITKEVLKRPDIELEAGSSAYVDKIFGMYKEVDELPPLEGKVIFHLYPTEDTRGNGYSGQLYFSLVVFDVDTRTMYTLGDRDGISFDGVNTQVGFFKDGSTLISCYGPLGVAIFQDVDVRKAV